MGVEGKSPGLFESESGKKPKGSDTDINKAHKGGNCHSILKEGIGQKKQICVLSHSQPQCD